MTNIICQFFNNSFNSSSKDLLTDFPVILSLELPKLNSNEKTFSGVAMPI